MSGKHYVFLLNRACGGRYFAADLADGEPGSDDTGTWGPSADSVVNQRSNRCFRLLIGEELSCGKVVKGVSVDVRPVSGGPAGTHGAGKPISI